MTAPSPFRVMLGRTGMLLAPAGAQLGPKLNPSFRFWAAMAAERNAAANDTTGRRSFMVELPFGTKPGGPQPSLLEMVVTAVLFGGFSEGGHESGPMRAPRAGPWSAAVESASIGGS